jgi:hypothetical protein
MKMLTAASPKKQGVGISPALIDMIQLIAF